MPSTQQVVADDDDSPPPSSTRYFATRIADFHATLDICAKDGRSINSPVLDNVLNVAEAHLRTEFGVVVKARHGLHKRAHVPASPLVVKQHKMNLQPKKRRPTKAQLPEFVSGEQAMAAAPSVVCSICKCADPPAGFGDVDWTQCELCEMWSHSECCVSNLCPLCTQ